MIGTLVQQLVQSFPVLTNTYYGNTLFDWLASLLIVLGFVLVGKILYWISGTVIKKLTAKTKTKMDDIIIDMIEEPVVFALFLLGLFLAVIRLEISDTMLQWIWKVFNVLIVINVAWLVARLFDALFREYLTPLTSKTKSDLDDQLFPVLRKGMKIIIWTLAILLALNNAGYNIGALLAGLGIGGIAFAMAAKDSIANIFGGITIFADKPFKLNDRIKIVGYDGFVREIGIRSTRIETLEGRIIVIPNSKFAENPVENVSIEKTRKVVLNLGLTYDTKPKKMEKAIKILRDIAKKNKHVENKVLVSFDSFGDSALGIFFAYYIKKDADILETQTEIHMAILEQFNKNKLDFAFPTKTVYNKKG